MSVELMRGDVPGLIPVRELEDGQLAEVLYPPHKGRIVQVYKGSLVVVGESKEKGWHIVPTSDDFLVRVLPDGATLTVFKNQMKGAKR